MRDWIYGEDERGGDTRTGGDGASDTLVLPLSLMVVAGVFRPATTFRILKNRNTFVLILSIDLSRPPTATALDTALNS